MITVLQACHRNNIYHMVFRAPFLQNYELNIVFYEASRLLLFNSDFCVPNLHVAVASGELRLQVQRGKEETPLGPPGLDAAFVLQDLVESFWFGENVDKRQGEKVKSGCNIYVIKNAMFS